MWIILFVVMFVVRKWIEEVNLIGNAIDFMYFRAINIIDASNESLDLVVRVSGYQQGQQDATSNRVEEMILTSRTCSKNMNAVTNDQL